MEIWASCVNTLSAELVMAMTVAPLSRALASKFTISTVRPLREVRPEVTEELAATVAKMMASEPSKRYGQPREAAAALMPFIRQKVRNRHSKASRLSAQS